MYLVYASDIRLNLVVDIILNRVIYNFNINVAVKVQQLDVWILCEEFSYHIIRCTIFFLGGITKFKWYFDKGKLFWLVITGQHSILKFFVIKAHHNHWKYFLLLIKLWSLITLKKIDCRNTQHWSSVLGLDVIIHLYGCDARI